MSQAQDLQFGHLHQISEECNAARLFLGVPSHSLTVAFRASVELDVIIEWERSKSVVCF